MSFLSESLKERNQGVCELCNINESFIAFTVSPKNDKSIQHQVAICTDCSESIPNVINKEWYWRCLEGSIWSQTESVQALSYRLLNQLSELEWAKNTLNSVDLEDSVKEWALNETEKKQPHTDAFGHELENGDNVVLTQALDVKGTNFTASKGTVVKRIRLVEDNPEQIEGKINEQMIVILTKFVKKN